MRSWRVLAFTGAALAGLLSGVGLIPGSSQTARAIEHGLVVNPGNPPPQWAAYIEARYDKKAYSCSGELVGNAQGDAVILTAGHCLYVTDEDNGTTIKIPAADFTVWLGVADPTHPTGTGYKVSVALADPDYDYSPGNTEYDVAVLRLDAAPPAGTDPVALAPNASILLDKTAVNAVGYGCTAEKFDSQGTPVKGSCTSSTALHVTRPGSYSEDVGCDQSTAYCFAQPASTGPFPSGTSTVLQGDSGGPWFPDMQDPYVVGISSHLWGWDKPDLRYTQFLATNLSVPQISNWLRTEGDLYAGTVNSIYELADNTGTNAWLFENDGFLHPITRAATLKCLTDAGDLVVSVGGAALPLFSFAELPQDSQAPATCSAPGSTWAVSASPLPKGDTGYYPPTVDAASCGEICAAVGQTENGSGDAQVVLWTLSGTTWDPVAAPLPSDAAPGTAGVGNPAELSCGGNACAVLGSYINTVGIVEQVLWAFNGSSWTATKATPPDGVQPGDVASITVGQGPSCGPSGVCAAGGYYTDTAGNIHPLLWILTGSAWTVTAAPLPPDAAANSEASGLVGGASQLSCGTGVCAAFSTYADTHGNTQGVFWTLTGSNWSAAKAPLIPQATSSPFSNANPLDLSCGTGVCAALGAEDLPNNTTRAAWFTFTGSAWTIYQPPASDNWTDGIVSCGHSVCGATANPNSLQQLANWTGSGWSISTPKLPAGDQDAFPGSISCASRCAAGGGNTDSSTEGTFWDLASGKWTATTAPAPKQAAPYVYVSQTSCGTTPLCAAAGSYLNASDASQGLLWTSQGSSWIYTKAPVPAGATSSPDAEITDVSCGAGTCVAFGTYNSSSYIGSALWATK